MESAEDKVPLRKLSTRIFDAIPRQFKAVLLGQLISLCLCGTAISSQFLSNDNYNAPTAQNLPTYLIFMFIYGSKLVCRDGFGGGKELEDDEAEVMGEEAETAAQEQKDQSQFVSILRDRGWKYLALAFIDVEAMVYAYQFTNITAIQLLDCFTIPVVMLLSVMFLAARYQKRHYAGVGICLLGLALTIYTDAFRGHGMEGGSNKLLGDLLCLAGTFLYAVANVSEEFLVKQYSRTEYLAMVGLFGFLISTLQVVLLEYRRLASFQWSALSVSMIGLFTLSMVFAYSLVSLVMRRASALLFNISALTADFYSLLAGVFIFGQKFDVLYLVAFIVIIFGTLIYSYKSSENTNPAERSNENETTS